MAQFGVINGSISLFESPMLISHEIKHEAPLRHEFEDVRRLLHSIQGTIKAYLNDTKGREGTVGQVQELEYQTEDALDEFMFQVPEHSHHHRFTKWLHKVRPSSKDLKAIEQLSKKIKCIEASIQKLKDTDAILEGVSSSSLAEIPPEAYSIPSDDKLVGINEKPREQLLRFLLNEESREVVVVSVLGHAGSGKTSLIREVYDKLTREGSFHCHAWIHVPRSFEDLKKICEAMVVPISRETSTRWMLHSEQTSYILVLDDIWNEDELKYVKSLLPNNNHGGRIIISTRNHNLASYCATSSDHIVQVNPLRQEEARELFCKKVFRGSQCPFHYLVEWCEKIVKLCDGLPHAIVAVGSSLSCKPRSEEYFKDVHDILKYDPAGTHVGYSYIRKFLQQNYCLLRPILKSCLLYLCNFPEDYYVTRERLVHLWIAEGFIEERNGRTLEKVADEYLDELVQISLVRVSTRDFEGRIRSCRVSNFVRGFILSKSEMDKLCIISRTSDTPEERTQCLSLHNCCPNMSKIRCLSLHNCCPNMSKIKGARCLSCVRTFFMFGKDLCSESRASQLFSHFKYLKVLDLENSSLACFPGEIVNLILLRYLSLRKTEIKSVPKSIKELPNLVILDLRQTLVTKLPKEIYELHKLLYLLADCLEIKEERVHVGVEVSPRIEGLTFLQKLSLIKAKHINIVKGLAKLVNLRKLGITELRREDGKDFCESIEKMENLSSLQVTSAGRMDYHDLNYVTKSPQLLNYLSLGGMLQKIPKWICSQSSLLKIELRWSKMVNSPLEDLGALPSLKELMLCDAYSGEKLVFEAKWFKELRMLEIEQFSQLRTVVIQEQAMPKLRKLTITECDDLSNIDVATTFLNQLEEKIIRIHHS